MKIDAFGHALPPAYRDFVFTRLGESFPFSRFWTEFLPLSDVNHRIGVLDEFGVDIQVVSTPGPPLEALASDADLASELARAANDGMAEYIAARPERLVGLATVSLRDPLDAASEIERCVKSLGFRGVLLYADSTRPPLDSPEFDPIFAAAESLDVAVWLHPWRSRTQPDYVDENESKYLSYYVFGWPYETTVALLRLAAGGVIERHPRLKVLAHHAGGMIPFYSTRMQLFLTERWVRMVGVPDDDLAAYARAEQGLRSIYVDAVTLGSASALMNTYEFFGGRQILFGTDTPWDPEGGRVFTRTCIEGVEGMAISEEEKEYIWYRNAQGILGLT